MRAFSEAENDISTSGVLSLTIRKSGVPEDTSCHLSIRTSEIVPFIGDVTVSFEYSFADELYPIRASSIEFCKLLSVTSLFFLAFARVF